MWKSDGRPRVHEEVFSWSEQSERVQNHLSNREDVIRGQLEQKEKGLIDSYFAFLFIPIFQLKRTPRTMQREVIQFLSSLGIDSDQCTFDMETVKTVQSFLQPEYRIVILQKVSHFF